MVLPVSVLFEILGTSGLTSCAPINFDRNQQIHILDNAFQKFSGHPTRSGADLSLDDALAELQNIDKAVEEALKTPGILPLPQNVTVAETTELETESLVQVSDSGDVSADCSSGSCECEEGFRKNNEGICQAIISENHELSNQIDCYDGNNGGCSHHCNQVSRQYRAFFLIFKFFRFFSVLIKLTQRVKI